ncbi:MAG: type II toxin-antitoxin system HicB family antitoxin [Bacteroidia bacterium]
MKLTAIIEKSEDGWYVGQLEEFPAALSQGKTIEELKANLKDALKLLMEANRDELKKEFAGKQYTIEVIDCERSVINLLNT